ncbi:protein NDH-DEPENDENT CYCLIC ELECTRON FLOW 5-like [Phragmites australis]|uniref:protein NDH-DEPENDENT CYCLIC ELECTRON FLOW 5-like n=1 Tax=Phragmites australis TaxID=29695 RepID=UPI002D783EA2|nr:protein NDH-DEPENDENT CYCLIC ELECTRON FLOW 5-like [Phragmites australis]
MAAFCTPAATTAPHATPAPLTRPWKHIALCHFSKLGSGGSQRTRLVSAAPQVRAVAPATAAEEAAGPSPINVEYLSAEFAGHGVSFEAVGISCAVKMALRNGSVAHLLLPSGLVTSYKPAMWHGSVTEVLHTSVAAGHGGRAVIRGGVSVDLHCAGGDGGWSPSGAWSLRDVRGNPTTSIEIELASAAPGDAAEARCVVTLHPEALATELSATNNAASSSPMALSCTVSNHLRVSTPDATYALGLQGSDYRSVEPALSEFSIIPPDYGAARQSAAGKARHRLSNKGFDMVLSGGQAHGAAGEPDGEEDDDYKHMTEEMCRVYSHAPREFTIIDRGRRNSICLHRRGFEELYVFSPGSQYQWYGKYAYVVVGPAMLEPVVLRPGDKWQGAQYLRNPNL